MKEQIKAIINSIKGLSEYKKTIIISRIDATADYSFLNGYIIGALVFANEVKSEEFKKASIQLSEVLRNV